MLQPSELNAVDVHKIQFKFKFIYQSLINMIDSTPKCSKCNAERLQLQVESLITLIRTVRRYRPTEVYMNPKTSTVFVRYHFPGFKMWKDDRRPTLVLVLYAEVP